MHFLRDNAIIQWTYLEREARGKIVQYIVLDLEWNQCPPGKEAETETEDLPCEVIEIGAVKLNEKLEIIEEYSEVIKPVVYRQMHPVCMEVTGISERDLERGVSFPRAFADFLAWCEEDYMFCTWGSSDLTELQRNLRYHGIRSPFPFPFYYYDVQKLFSLSCEDGRSRKALHHAVEALQIEEKEVYHRACSDAWYTAKVLSKIDFDRVKDRISVDYFRVPEKRSEEIRLVFDTYSKEISSAFSSREQLMADSRLLTTRCHKCGRNAKKHIRWFSDNMRSYYSLSCCKEHGWLKGKIRIRKNIDGRYYGIKTMRLVDEEEANRIRERQAELRKKRRHRITE